MTTDRELMQMALDALEKLVNETPTTHVRAGKAQIGGKEVVALWFDDCSDPLQQAIYINATKPEKIKEFLKQVRDRLAQPELEFSIQAGKHRQPLKQVDPSSVYLTKPNNPTPSIEAALDKMVAENERLGLYDDLDEAIKKGTKAWEGVDPTEWVEELRGGPERVHASDISQERVDETAKDRHDIVGSCVTCGAPHGFWLSAPPTDFISPSVVKAISKREWAGQPDLARVGEVGVWGGEIKE